MTAKTDKTRERLEAVVAPIIAAIEAGIDDPVNWTAPWHNAEAGVFDNLNPVTGRSYTAGNRWVLAAEHMAGAENHWATYKHWASLSKHTAACDAAIANKGKRNESRPGCGPDCKVVNVRRGAKATWLFRPRKVTRTDEATGETKTFVSGFSVFPVFHSGDVDGYERPVVERAPLPGDAADDIDAAFDFALATGAVIRESEHAGAFYSPGFDEITVPARDRWTDSHGTWSTLAHELVHWTGHKSRLDRDLKPRFDAEEYAFEELIAELGAAFTLAKVGRSTEPRADHAEYLKSWLRALKADPKLLWKAASAAEKAAEFITTAAGVAAPATWSEEVAALAAA
jgi:antirestriction protein ArdC